MPNYIDDDTALPDQRIDRRPIPPGQDPDKFVDADFCNALLQFDEDARDAIQALQSAGGAFALGSMASDPLGAGIRNDGGYIHNYSDASITAKKLLIFKGADNEGSRITGIVPTGLAEGDIRVFLNWGDLGLIDAGTVTLVDQNDTNASSSTAANRFMCPGGVSVTIPPWGVALLARAKDADGSARWAVIGCNNYFNKAVVQSLNFYPNLQVGEPGTPLSGTYNNWDPTGVSSWAPAEGLGGSNLKFRDHSFIRLYVDSGGASITGIDANDITPAYFGPLKILLNYGPGTLTLKHLSASSDVDNRINCPYSRDLVIPQYGAALVIHPYYAQPASGTPQWHVIGMANEEFPSVNTATRVKTPEFRLTPALAPAALSSGRTDNWSPGTRGTFVHATTNNAGSSLSGMVPPSADVLDDLGLVRCLVNDGNGPLMLLDQNANSSANNRFYLEMSVVVVPSKGSVWLTYDDIQRQWRVMGKSSQHAFYRTLAITPHTTDGVIANSDVHNFTPTGWNTARVWRLVPGGASSALTGMGDGTQQDGWEICIISYDNTLTIKHNNGGSNAANRFFLPSGNNIALALGCSATFRYDANNGLWNCIAKAL